MIQLRLAANGQPDAVSLRAAPKRSQHQIPATPAGATPTSLVIAVDSSNGQLPPATTVVPLAAATEELEARVSPDATSVTIRAAVRADNGAVSPTTAVSAQPTAP
jgi:hypothetical protein